MDWHAFHFTIGLVTLAYAALDLRPLVGRQFMFGAEIHLAVVILSGMARDASGDISPIALYCILDMAAVSLFALIMWRKKAIWAALCVIAHSVMLALHFAFFIAGQVGEAAYLWTLGILTFVIAATINAGTWAGRHEPGKRWDDFLSHRLRGWSWTGSVASRLSAYKKQVG